MTISFQKMGEGQPLIVIHGLFGTSDNLKSIARELSDQFCVYLIDAPAHGDSNSLQPITLESMARQVIAFLEHQGINEAAFLGHSLGGKIAMEIALINPALISKLIVADIAPVQYQRRHDEIIAGLKSIPLSTLENRQAADKLLQNFIAEVGVRSFLLKSLVRNKEKNGWHWRFDLDGLARDYDNLIGPNRDGLFEKPVLFVIGSKSNYVSESHRPEITKRFPSVQAKSISGAGHWLHAERPVAFVKICRDFLNQ